MSNSKMSPEELKAETQRLQDLIAKRNKAEVEAVKELSKRPLSQEEYEAQIERIKKNLQQSKK